MARADIETKIDLDSSGLRKGIQKAKKSVSNFSKSAVAQIGRVGAAFAGVGLVKSIINLGTSAAETASKFQAVFGPATEEMQRNVEELKKTIPATTKEMQDALATFGQMAASFGLNSEAANKFSVNMVKIAGDLASFHNLRPEEAFLKIRSAISGEFEPMKQLGIVINEATLKQEALNKGIWDGTGAMSAAQKALVVQSLLIKQMGTANGDAAATADSAANQIKFLQASLKDTGAEIGQTVLPAVVKLVEWTNALVGAAKSASEAVGTLVAENIYGKQQDDPLGGWRESAKQKLKREGKLEGFKGRGGTQKMKKLIEEEAKALKDRYDQRIKEQKESEKVLKQEEKLAESATDPARKKAADDYLNSLNEQIKAAGKLEGITKATVKAEKAKKTEGPVKVGAEIERKEGESGAAFMKRRQQARSAYLALQSDDAGYFNPKTMETLQAIARGEQPAGAGEKKPGGDVVEKNTTEMASLLTSINKGING